MGWTRPFPYYASQGNITSPTLEVGDLGVRHTQASILLFLLSRVAESISLKAQATHPASICLIAVKAWPLWLFFSGPESRKGQGVVAPPLGGAGDFRGQEGKGVELQLGALGTVITQC